MIGQQGSFVIATVLALSTGCMVGEEQVDNRRGYGGGPLSRRRRGLVYG
jgi:hypothetical protein